MKEPTPVLVILPLTRVEAAESDRWLGDSLARTLRRRLEASGRRVVPLDTATHVCEGLGIELGGEEPLGETEREWLLAQTGATHLIRGDFAREGGRLRLALEVSGADGEGHGVKAEGPEGDFQEVIDDAIVRLIQNIPGATGEHVRGALRKARTTESLEAFLAVVRARRAWSEGEEQSFEDEVAAAIRLDPAYSDPHEVVAAAARESGDLERQLESLAELARVHGASGRRHDQARALLSIGYAHVEDGAWEDAIESYQGAAELFDALAEVRGAVQARMNVANVLLRTGQAESAIEEYTQGLERIKEFPEDYAKHVFNLGLALKETGELPMAVERLEEALAQGFQLRDEELISSAYNALGAVYDDLDDHDKALSHFRRAEEHLDAKADPILLAGVKDNIGIILKKQGELEAALRYSEQACELLESRGAPLHVAIAYVNRAGLLIELERPDEAAPFAVAAHREFVRLQSPSRETTLEMLVELEFDEDSIELIESEALDDEGYEDEHDEDSEEGEELEDGDESQEDESGLDELEIDEDDTESDLGDVESADDLEDWDEG